MTRERPLFKLVLEVLFLALFFTALFVYSFRPNWDIDIFWHMKTGEWIVENGRLPHTDIFSATDPDRAWTTFQWAYEVITNEVNSRFGFGWVRALHAGLFVSAFAFFYLLFRRTLPGRAHVAFFLLLTLVLAGDRLRIRPEAFLFLFMALALPILTGHVRTRGRPSWAVLFSLAVLAIAWSNVHAGGALWLALALIAVLGGRVARLVAIGMAVKQGFGDDEKRQTAREDVVGAVWLAGFGILPILPMPGFINGAITALTMYKDSAILIPEWHPPAAYFNTAIAGRLTAHHWVCGIAPYLVFAWAGGESLLWGARTVKAIVAKDESAPEWSLDVGLLALALFFAILGIKSGRFIYLSALSAYILVIYRRTTMFASARSIGIRSALLLVTVILAMASYDHSIIKGNRGLTRTLDLLALDNEPGAFPVAASDTISAMGLVGRIFHQTTWGGYLIYRHFPDCTVFTDGRGNFTIDERDVLTWTHLPYERDESLVEAWNRYPFEILIMRPPVFPLLTWDHSQWVRIYADNTAEVYLHNDEDNRANIERAIAYWQRMGIDAGDDADMFQNEYRRVLMWETLRRPEVDLKLANAATRAIAEDIGTKASGFYDGALVLFDAGRYDGAARFFQKVLATGMRHSTSALYLAWSLYLDDRVDEAREVIRREFMNRERGMQPDLGQLRWGGHQIFKLLLPRLGLPPMNNPG